MNQLLREGETLGSPKCVGSSGVSLRVEIAIQSIHGRFENHTAIGATFEVTLDLSFDGRGEPPL
jgi:hypothetical protein